jgi:hypothetical protein
MECDFAGRLAPLSFFFMESSHKNESYLPLPWSRSVVCSSLQARITRSPLRLPEITWATYNESCMSGVIFCVAVRSGEAIRRVVHHRAALVMIVLGVYHLTHLTRTAEFRARSPKALSQRTSCARR